MSTVWENKNIVDVIKSGGVVVMPTDTIYGIVGSAENQDTVERIYEIRKRKPEKPCILLISSIEDIARFSIVINMLQKKVLKEFWPGRVSIVLDSRGSSMKYLHRGTETLAFRVPEDENLRNLLKQTGPLIAPSANTEGNIPSRNINDAKNYFGDEVDLYIDGGEIEGKASRVVRLNQDGSFVILRD